jgi:hypothetical protein
VALIDLTAAAGAFAGAVATTVNRCLPNPNLDCSFASDQRTARFTLAGGAVGLVAGWFLTRNFDRARETTPEPAPEPRELGFLPIPSAIPVQGRSGVTVIPGLSAQGRF